MIQKEFVLNKQGFEILHWKKLKKMNPLMKEEKSKLNKESDKNICKMSKIS